MVTEVEIQRDPVRNKRILSGNDRTLEGGLSFAGREINWRQDGIKASQESKHLPVGCCRARATRCTRVTCMHVHNIVARNVHLASCFLSKVAAPVKHVSSPWFFSRSCSFSSMEHFMGIRTRSVYVARCSSFYHRWMRHETR